MASTKSIAIVGLSRLLTRFDKLGDVDMTPAVGRAVAVVQGTAKSLAPVDTGELKGSINKSVSRSGDGGYVGRVFTNFEYAPYVEFGTGKKGDGTYPYSPKGVSLTYRQTPWSFEKDGERIWTNGQVAQPFMFPALKQNEANVRKILRDEYKRLTAQIVK